MSLPAQSQSEFVGIVKDYYAKHKRILPWRELITPYSVFISEIMLQQTQVSRVLTKYPLFLSRFPDFQTLASAPFSEILAKWKGMGYNRRAKYLKQAAQIIVERYAGIIPDKPELVDELPGIGHATAHSIVTFIYNRPCIFIETNIRRVFIHHFFSKEAEVADQQIVPLIDQTIDSADPRQWYYALMDYGSHLATQVPNPNRRSKHYAKQAPFEGSNRQLRGQILELVMKDPVSRLSIEKLVSRDKKQMVENALNQLEQEGFILKEKDHYIISKR